MGNNKYENTYDIEFCVSTPAFFRVQAYTVEEAMKIAHERFLRSGMVLFTPANANTDIVMIRKREDICDLGACNEDMTREYNYLKTKAK